MLLLPAPRHNAMYAFYAFCREVHGATCGGAARTGKLALLADWRAEIALLFAGRPQHTVTQALRDPVSRFDLRFEDFLLILDGMEMEVRSDIRAPSLAQLDLYCERAVVPVGRIALRIFGTATPDADRVAASLGRALQLTGILRDLAQDATRQHLYLPRELLHAHGIFATYRATCWRSRRYHKYATSWANGPPRTLTRPSARSRPIHHSRYGRPRQSSPPIARCSRHCSPEVGHGSMSLSTSRLGAEQS
jgi:phytoene/squalene synthetase